MSDDIQKTKYTYKLWYTDTDVYLLAIVFDEIIPALGEKKVV